MISLGVDFPRVKFQYIDRTRHRAQIATFTAFRIHHDRSSYLCHKSIFFVYEGAKIQKYFVPRGIKVEGGRGNGGAQTNDASKDRRDRRDTVETLHATSLQVTTGNISDENRESREKSMKRQERR
jgi:hypothetical protein